MCQEFELDIEATIIPKIAFGFTGGIGNTGDVCGAVAGAVMAIGLKQEQSKNIEESLQSLAVVQEFRRSFEDKMGTINCREFTGADLSTPEGIEQYMSSDTPQTVCFPAVGVANKLVTDVLNPFSWG